MSMYLDHFGLREAPFRITPHTDFFFSGANRGSTLGALLYAITHDEGIVRVTGEVGSGKTMLCRMLLEKLPATVETIYLANPSLSRDELLHALADELKMTGLPKRVAQLLRALQQHLVDVYASGRQIVVLIDEAHAMPPESLEEIRLLSNLESNRHKLLQIVLFGQPELDAMLAQQNLRQLRERITHNFRLEPLRRDDVGTYLMFRLRAAGYHGPDLFSSAALKLFAQASGGLTRRLNVLGDKALLAAFAADQHEIDGKIAKAAVRDAEFGRLQGAPKLSRRPLWIGAVAGALATAGVLAGYGWAMKPASSLPTADLTAHGSPSPSLSPAPAASPATMASPAPTASPAPATAPAPTLSPTPASSPAPATAASAAAAALLPAEPVVIAGPAVASRAAPTPPDEQEAPPHEPGTPLLEQHSGAFKRWIHQASGQHYAIQLARATGDRRDDIEVFLRTARRLLPPEELRVYSATANGRHWLGVVYGDFSAFSAAEKRLNELPAALTGYDAFVRPIRQLKPNDMS